MLSNTITKEDEREFLRRVLSGEAYTKTFPLQSTVGSVSFTTLDTQSQALLDKCDVLLKDNSMGLMTVTCVLYCSTLTLQDAVIDVALPCYRRTLGNVANAYDKIFKDLPEEVFLEVGTYLNTFITFVQDISLKLMFTDSSTDDWTFYATLACIEGKLDYKTISIDNRLSLLKEKLVHDCLKAGYIEEEPVQEEALPGEEPLPEQEEVSEQLQAFLKLFDAQKGV
jgi:hypothetical protein